MTTIDKLLLKIVNHTTPAIEEIIPKRDSRVLRSLGTSVEGNFFITENQARLLVKILRENAKKMTEFTEEIDRAIAEQLWSRRFRQIEQVKKLYIGKDDFSEPCLILEFSFNSQIRKNLGILGQKLENFRQDSSAKNFQADLTEKNIVALVEGLTPYGFDISDEIKGHYETIKSWSKSEISDQFLITSITNQNFHKQISNDLGMETAIDTTVLKDRSVRYNFSLADEGEEDESLVKRMAYRKNTRFWVDKNTYTIADMFNSLVQLKRFPVMVVFDGSNETKAFSNLEAISEIIENIGFSSSTGVYFRLPSTTVGSQFNKLIADKQYNKKLDNDTKVVVVQSGKIPKFFLTNTWRPMSVIILDSNMSLRHGKTAVYANCCDLILEYAEDPPISDKRLAVWP